MKARGILEDVTSIFDRICSKSDLDCDMLGLAFRICTKIECILPVPHGDVYREDEIIGSAADLMDGLTTVVDLVEADKCSIAQGANLFQQMREADIPADNDDAKTRFDALPDEAKAEFIQTLRGEKLAMMDRLGVVQVSKVELPGGSVLTIVNIDEGTVFGKVLVDMFGNPFPSEKKPDDGDESSEEEETES